MSNFHGKTACFCIHFNFVLMTTCFCSFHHFTIILCCFSNSDPWFILTPCLFGTWVYVMSLTAFHIVLPLIKAIVITHFQFQLSHCTILLNAFLKFYPFHHEQNSKLHTLVFLIEGEEIEGGAFVSYFSIKRGCNRRGYACQQLFNRKGELREDSSCW